MKLLKLVVVLSIVAVLAVAATSAFAAAPVTQLSLSGPVLELEDLPEGFLQIDLEASGVNDEALAAAPFTVNSGFAFVHPDSGEGIGGGTVSLETVFDQIGYDLMIGSPSLATNMAMSDAPENITIVEQELLPIDPIGNKSIGVSTVVDIDGTEVVVDVVAFRIDGTGGGVGQVYFADQEPAVSVEELAGMLVDQIQ